MIRDRLTQPIYATRRPARVTWSEILTYAEYSFRKAARYRVEWIFRVLCSSPFPFAWRAYLKSLRVLRHALSIGCGNGWWSGKWRCRDLTRLSRVGYVMLCLLETVDIADSRISENRLKVMIYSAIVNVRIRSFEDIIFQGCWLLLEVSRYCRIPLFAGFYPLLGPQLASFSIKAARKLGCE